MIDKDIINGNSILAEYMGWKRTNEKLDEYPGFENPNQKGHINFIFKYDTDWNELMQVVEKIESTDYPYSDLRFTIAGNYCGIIIHDNGRVQSEVITEHIEKSKIEAVWKACLDFVAEIKKTT